MNDANVLMAPKNPTEAELNMLYRQFYYGV